MKKLLFLSLLYSICACSTGTTNPYARLNISYDEGETYTAVDCMWKRWAIDNFDNSLTFRQNFKIWRTKYPSLGKIYDKRDLFFESLSSDQKAIFVEIEIELKKKINCFDLD